MSAAAVAPIEVQSLSKRFAVGTSLLRREELRAVDDVSFALQPARVTALVGESGSGKSTVARLIAKLYVPSGGSLLFHGKDVSKANSRKALLRYRSQVQMIFQDPFGSLNPVKRVEHHIARPLHIHGVVPRRDVPGRVRELLTSVGLVPADQIAQKYPHQLSGGQQQRVAIARALAVEPEVLIADEPISMLDVSIRIGVLNLILQLKETRRIAFLYITHDIASARYVADELLVMYAGRIVEHGPTESVLGEPLHAYTKLLLSAVPDPEAGFHGRQVDTRGAARVAAPTGELVEARPGHWVRRDDDDPLSTQ